MEGLAGQATQVAGLRPLSAHAGQRMNPSILAGKEPEAKAAKPLRRVEAPGSGKDQIGDAQAQVHGIEEAQKLPAFLVDHLRAQFEQHFGNIDFDRADFVTSAAERRGVGQGLRVLHLHQLRREDCADRPRINRAVGVAAGLPVDRAGVHAGRAADALQRLPLLGNGQN